MDGCDGYDYYKTSKWSLAVGLDSDGLKLKDSLMSSLPDDILYQISSQLSANKLMYDKNEPNVLSRTDVDENYRAHEGNQYLIYKVELAKIEKVINYQLSQIRATDTLSQDQLRQLIDSYSDDSDEDENEDRQIDFKYGLDVNSYNVKDPIISYPKNLDLRHDGIDIYLDCTTSKGKPFQCRYWGD